MEVIGASPVPRRPSALPNSSACQSPKFHKHPAAVVTSHEPERSVPSAQVMSRTCDDDGLNLATPRTALRAKSSFKDKLLSASATTAALYPQAMLCCVGVEELSDVTPRRPTLAPLADEGSVTKHLPPTPDATPRLQADDEADIAVSATAPKVVLPLALREIVCNQQQQQPALKRVPESMSAYKSTAQSVSPPREVSFFELDPASPLMLDSTPPPLTTASAMQASGSANSAIAHIIRTSPAKNCRDPDRVLVNGHYFASPQQLAGHSNSLLKRKHMQRILEAAFENPEILKVSPARPLGCSGAASPGGVLGDISNQQRFTPKPPPRPPTCRQN